MQQIQSTVPFPRETTRCYQLAVAFHGHVMALVPLTRRGNSARTMIERATLRAMIQLGEAIDGPPSRRRTLVDQSVLSIDRAMIILDGLRACERVSDAEHAECRRRALEIRDEAATLRIEITAAPKAPSDAVTYDASPAVSTARASAPKTVGATADAAQKDSALHDSKPITPAPDTAPKPARTRRQRDGNARVAMMRVR